MVLDGLMTMMRVRFESLNILFRCLAFWNRGGRDWWYRRRHQIGRGCENFPIYFLRNNRQWDAFRSVFPLQHAIFRKDAVTSLQIYSGSSWLAKLYTGIGLCSWGLRLHPRSKQHRHHEQLDRTDGPLLYTISGHRSPGLSFHYRLLHWLLHLTKVRRYFRPPTNLHGRPLDSNIGRDRLTILQDSRLSLLLAFYGRCWGNRTVLCCLCLCCWNDACQGSKWCWALHLLVLWTCNVIHRSPVLVFDKRMES